MRIPTRTTRQIKVRADTITRGITAFFSDSNPSARPIRDSWLLLLASVVGENGESWYLNLKESYNIFNQIIAIFNQTIANNCLPLKFWLYDAKNVYDYKPI